MNKEEALIVIGNLLEVRKHYVSSLETTEKSIRRMAEPFNIQIDFEKNVIVEVVTK